MVLLQEIANAYQGKLYSLPPFFVKPWNVGGLSRAESALSEHRAERLEVPGRTLN